MPPETNLLSRFQTLLFLLPFLFVGGCAVLTVDVDVYKGALVNDPNVQTKQLAAMTMAAKPILEHLYHTATNTFWRQKSADSNSASNASEISPDSPDSSDNAERFDPELVPYDPDGIGPKLLSLLNLYKDNDSIGPSNSSYSNELVSSYSALTNSLHRLERVHEWSTNNTPDDNNTFRTNTPYANESEIGVELSLIRTNADKFQNAITYVKSQPAVSNKLSSQNMTNLEQFSQSITTFVQNMDKVPFSTRIGKKLAQTLETAKFEPVLKKADQITQDVNRAESAAHSLDAARAHDGLVTIIRRYRNSAITNGDDSPLTEYFRRQLLISTVDFAETIKFLSDNEFSGESLDVVQFKRQSMALQAIGNSILSLADALTQRDSYEQKQTNSLVNYIASISTNASRYLSNSAQTNLVLNVGDESQTLDLRQAQDLVIEELKNIQITATLDGSSDLAARAKAALSLATTYRQDNIYIMPAMAYLRSSYPATDLQQNDDGLWRNMLDEQAWRSLPWPADEMAANKSIHLWSPDSDARTQAQIDKQFWQNINRIRVAGSGITSYVITKDDIGNWYIKNYTSDPTPIIEGAKSLALASAPAALSPKQLAAGVVPPAPNTNAEPGLLTTELNIVTKTYTDKALEDGTNIFDWSTGLRATLFGPSIIPTNATFAQTNAPLNFSNALVSQAVQGTEGQIKANLAYANSTNLLLSTNAITSSVTNSWVGEFSLLFTNEFGESSTPTTNSYTVTTNLTISKIIPLSTNQTFTNLVPYAFSFQTTNNQTDATLTRSVTNNLTNSVTFDFTLANVGTFKTNLTLSDSLVLACTDIVTNLFPISLTNVIATNFVQTITNSFSITVSNLPTNAGAYMVSGSITNKFTNFFIFQVTNTFQITVTNTFNHPGVGPNSQATGTNFAFFDNAYNRYVTNALASLNTLLMNKQTVSTNGMAVAAQELKLLDQWDRLMRQIALTGNDDQKRILTNMAPQLRVLVRDRMQSIKEYQVGLSLLSQSQQK